MRIISLAVIGGVIGCIMNVPTLAQNYTGNALTQPISAQTTAFASDTYLYFAPHDESNPPSPDQQAPSKQQTSDPGADPSTSCCNVECGQACCGDPGCGRCCGLGLFACNLGDPWTLPQPRAFANNDIKISGWLEGGIFTNQYDATTNGPLGLRDQKYFNADQLWIYAERATNTEDNDFDIGGRVDYVFGVDGPDTQCFGDHSFDWNWTSSFTSAGAPLYGSAMPQLYAEVAYRKLKVKMGHFYTLIGYEVVPATGNFFYSHSYMFYYGEPFTHTGVLATYQFNDKLTGSAGWANGWDSGFGDKNHGSTFLGGLTWTISEKATLAWYMCSGYWGTGAAFPGAATNDIFMQSIVFTLKLTDKWTYILQHDYGTNYNRPDENLWYGLNQYLIYTINDCWAFGGRIEWFHDDDGVRVIAGNAGNYYEMSAGVNYKPHANFLIRPEIRYDWYNGTTGGGNPFDDGNATTQLSGGFDVIFTY
jgi:hypothetical protein